MHGYRKGHAITRFGVAAAVNLLVLTGPRAEEPNCAEYGTTPNQACSPDDLYHQGVEHLQRGDHDLGIIALSKAIRLAPESPFAFLSRATAYAAKGEDYLALAHYSVAIGRRKDPLFNGTISAYAYSNRGMIFSKIGEYEMALADFKSALEMKRNLNVTYRFRAETFLRLGKLTEALTDVNRALWVMPLDAAGYALRARIYGALGRTAEAALENAQVGALFPPVYGPGISSAQLYPSPASRCIDDDKHLLKISIGRGKVTVQPLYVGAEGNIAIWRNEEGMMLRFGKEGCRIDVEVGRDINQTSKTAKIASDAEDITLSPSMEPPSYAQVLYKEPSSACTETKVRIRAYWGVVEYDDDYHPPPGVVLPLNLSRRYGDSGCQIDVRVSKVD